MPGAWWERAVVYQVYPRSYADSNGDGIGDLPGLTSRLDHLEWLGVDALWLSPTFPSPNADWGYDVADYLGVHPDLGTPADLERLIAEARRRHIRVLLDLVPNHTSDRNPWFHDPAKRDWYIWRDAKPDGSPPNNWFSIFGGPAWTFDPERGQSYLHTFLPQQPDLDWRNEDVRDAFDEILRYWFDRGVGGFRIDVAHALIKDAGLRDNPPARPDEAPYWAGVDQWPKHNFGLPGAVDVHRGWRRVADEYDPERLLLGETYVLDLDVLMQYVVPDGLHLCMNLPFLHAPFVAEELAAVVAATEGLLPPGATPVWHASSHDDPRFATRWCGGDERLIRCTLVALLSLRGAAILFQGDEIGLETVDVPMGRRLDIVGRDPCRTPMVWRDEGGAGFTAPGVEPLAADRLARAQRRRPARRPELDPDADPRLDRVAATPSAPDRRVRGARRAARRLGLPAWWRRARRRQPRRPTDAARPGRRGRSPLHRPCSRRRGRARQAGARPETGAGGVRCVEVTDASGGRWCTLFVSRCRRRWGLAMILCEECQGAIETSDPDVVYAVELREVVRFLGTELVEGTGFYFHDECFPWDSPRYREKPRPARVQQVA